MVTVRFELCACFDNRRLDKCSSHCDLQSCPAMPGPANVMKGKYENPKGTLACSGRRGNLSPIKSSIVQIG